MAPNPQLPVQQLAILSICRFAEPIVYTSIQPYLPEMIEHFGIAKDDVGRWAGICGSAFSLSQCLTAILWGRASDHFGRKSTILTGLVLTMITSFLFGFAPSLPTAIAIRAVAGLGNGNGGILRTMAAEMVPYKKLQARAFSIMPLMFNVGSFLGPSIGGGLANPVERYPTLFGGSTLLQMFPYALPNVVNSALFLISISTGWLFLRETLSTKKDLPDYGVKIGKALTSCCRRMKSLEYRRIDEEESILPNGDRDSPSYGAIKPDYPATPPMTPPFSWRDVFASQSSINLLESLTLGMHSVAFDQMLPVFMHHPRPNTPYSFPLGFSGGYGLDSKRIGFILMLNGLLGMAFQLIVFPPVAKRVGILKCLRVSALLFVGVYIIFPFTALISSENRQQVTGLILIVFKNWLTVFAFPCNAILLTNSSSSSKTLGTLNGVATSVAAIGRTIGPAAGGIMFTLGMSNGYGVLPWWTIAMIAMIAAVPVFWMEDMPLPKGITEEISDTRIRVVGKIVIKKQ
ncbi:hypothetical protein MMC25_004143 [Agyrium rufum]|nr:hypothetical protein [Agyrium rufum]